MTETNEQLASYSIWSGKRKQNYSHDLLDCLFESQKNEAAPVGKNITSLALEVIRDTKKAMEDLQVTNKMRMGTVDWFTIAGATPSEGEDGTVAIAPVLRGDFFLSRD